MGNQYGNGMSKSNLNASVRKTPSPGTLLQTTTASESAGIAITQLAYDGGRAIAAVHAPKPSDMAGRATLACQLETLQIDASSAYYAVLSDNATVAAEIELVHETSENSVRAKIRSGAAARTESGRSAVPDGAGSRTARDGPERPPSGCKPRLPLCWASMPTSTSYRHKLPQRGAANQSTYAAALKRALLLRPDYLAAAYSVTASRENLRYARLARFPALAAGATDTVSRSFDNTYFGSNGALPIDGSGYDNVKRLGLGLTVPTCDQGLTNYNVTISASQLNQATANLRLSQLTVESDVRTALASLISARANLLRATSARSAAQVSLNATQAQ